MPNPTWKWPASLKPKTKPRAGALLLVVLMGIIGVAAAAAQGSGPELIRSVILANGGGSASAGGVTLNDTFGQPFAGPSASTDNSVSLMSGYWINTQTIVYVYLPLVVR